MCSVLRLLRLLQVLHRWHRHLSFTMTAASDLAKTMKARLGLVHPAMSSERSLSSKAVPATNNAAKLQRPRPVAKVRRFRCTRQIATFDLQRLRLSPMAISTTPRMELLCGTQSPLLSPCENLSIILRNSSATHFFHSSTLDLSLLHFTAVRTVCRGATQLRTTRPPRRRKRINRSPVPYSLADKPSRRWTT